MSAIRCDNGSNDNNDRNGQEIDTAIESQFDNEPSNGVSCLQKAEVKAFDKIKEKGNSEDEDGIPSPVFIFVEFVIFII